MILPPLVFPGLTYTAVYCTAMVVAVAVAVAVAGAGAGVGTEAGAGVGLGEFPAFLHRVPRVCH